VNKAAELKRLINAPDILALPAVHDGFSTRLVQHMGYAAAFVTGGGLSESRLGVPDLGFMGLEDNLAAVRVFTSCSDLILLADGDTGYGNALNTYHTVRAFERAGVAGLMIEDQLWPKRCGHYQGKQVIAMDEMVDKIRAAASARVDPDFIIKSRTDSLATHGIDEVIKRLNAYAEAGADLLFADALLSRDHIATVARNVAKPLCVNMGFGLRKRSTTPLLSAAELQDLGVSVVIYPRMLTACALMGMRNGLELLGESLRTGKVVERPDALVSFEELNEIMGLAQFDAQEKEFATPAAQPAAPRATPSTGASRAGRKLPAGTVDCHAHVMRTDIALAPEIHSAPKFNITVQDYLAQLDANGADFGVLTAPSFYGTNNALMLEALTTAKGRLRGTAIVSPNIGHDALAAMHSAGVDGIRLNLVQKKVLPDLASPAYQRLFGALRELDMHVEIYVEGRHLGALLPHIEREKPKVVVDHFGSPEPDSTVRGEGFKVLLDALRAGRTWVKLSAPYRLGGVDAQQYVDAFLAAGARDRMVWATDFPFVKYESVITYAQCVDWIFQWIPDEALRRKILVENPRGIFSF
jgi:2-methylisocitrate lyase-like PEP mutase family enzyme/predicted TIM-barrel fold metal-dependent hydrolase